MSERQETKEDYFDCIYAVTHTSKFKIEVLRLGYVYFMFVRSTTKNKTKNSYFLATTNVISIVENKYVYDWVQLFYLNKIIECGIFMTYIRDVTPKIIY